VDHVASSLLERVEQIATPKGTRRSASSRTVRRPRPPLDGPAAGALVTLPLAFIGTFGDAMLWIRVAITAAIGALGGGTVGFIVGGGMAAKGPDEPLAAEQGVAVRVADARDEVVEALGDDEPIRLDTVAPSGRKTSTVTTDEGTDRGRSSAGPGPECPSAGGRLV
jgi:hypothetical protein